MGEEIFYLIVLVHGIISVQEKAIIITHWKYGTVNR